MTACRWPVFAAFFCVVSVSAAFARDAGPVRDLWLLGGGERVCSSTDPEHCSTDKRAELDRLFLGAEALRGPLFRFSESGAAQLARFPSWPGDELRRRRVLAALAEQVPQRPAALVDEAAWHQWLQPLALNDDEALLFDDVFEQRPLTAAGKTQRVLVDLDASAPEAQTLYRSFVAAARTRVANSRAPRVVFLTSSSRDPYRSVDYYRALFRAAGAEALWLPLEPAWAQGVGCEAFNGERFRLNGAWDRASRYPELVAEQRALCRDPEKVRALIDSADAFFINGGDQSLTLRSLQSAEGKLTEFAQRLLRRVEQGVPLGGTSAGTAVQAGSSDQRLPMISGGNSETAMQMGAVASAWNTPLCRLHQTCAHAMPEGRLLYRAEGGLPLFSLGVTDTHFRERNREGRLLRLLLDTHTDFGFGVDEETALRAQIDANGAAQLSVLGRGGVWIADARDAGVRASASLWQVRDVRVSRLLAGDAGQFSRDGVFVYLQCEAAPPVTQLENWDTSTYRNNAQWRWQVADRLPRGLACQREDGRWRYHNVPLRLQVDLL